MGAVIIGIDEVGRGSLAGPVVVCAVAIPAGLRIRNSELGTMRDSKGLSPEKRERWFKFFSAGGESSSGGKNHPKISYTLARVYPRRIEKINISRAANLAALHAFSRLVSGIKYQVSGVYLDGGLYLGNHRYIHGHHRTDLEFLRKSAYGRRLSATAVVATVVKGDEKIRAIKIASIIAKVSRDAQMRRLAKKYPSYSFEIHKGYGTRVHLAAIKKFGPSEVHRLTFIKKHTIIKRA